MLPLRNKRVVIVVALALLSAPASLTASRALRFFVAGSVRVDGHAPVRARPPAVIPAERGVAQHWLITPRSLTPPRYYTQRGTYVTYVEFCSPAPRPCRRTSARSPPAA